MRWNLVSVLVLLLLSGAFLLWFLKLGGGDDPSPSDQDLLMPFAAVPATENGFALLEEAAGLVQLPGDDSGAAWPTRPAPEGSGPEKHAVDAGDLFFRMLEGKTWDDALAAVVLERNLRALELVAEALARPRFQVPPRGLTDPVPHLKAARDAACVLAIQSQALARGGRTREAVEAALQAVRLGRRLADGGGPLIDHLFGSAVEQTGLRAVRSLVLRLGSDETRTVIAELERLRPGADVLRSALHGEYGFFVRCLDAVAAGKLRVQDALGTSGGLADNPPSGLEGALEAVNETLVTSRYLFKPLRTRRLAAEALRILLDEIERPYGQRTQHVFARCGVSFPEDRTASNGIGAWLAASSVLMMESALTVRDRLEVAFSATRVLLALRAFRLEAGSLPETLSELVPRHLDAVPRDPFDGAPLRYSREKLKVWAVGLDLEDSGGGEPAKDGESLPPDDQEPAYRIDL